VIDIGGGSTEFVIGEGFDPLYMESLHMGCVSISQQFFADGSITKKRFKRALTAARAELEPIEASFRRRGWDRTIGASGTIRAAMSVLQAMGASRDEITPEALKFLASTMIELGHVDALDLPGLDPQRAPVFPGGIAVLIAAFESLDIRSMQVADGALREGLLYDLLGRIRHEDVRGRSVAALADRYHVDMPQAARVEQTAHDCLQQTADAWELDPDEAGQLLAWAAQLHEIGLDIAHNKYHKHGAYIIANADLLGFSQPEQRMLAALVRNHRRKFDTSAFAEFPADTAAQLTKLAIILRLAVLLHRSRSEEPIPPIHFAVSKKTIRLHLPADWQEQHPLTWVDLEQEASNLRSSGYALEFENQLPSRHSG
jgi:exopolyphosphatase/guanosine-5'-triphosphate,3'-diphosphate pyrophosphatase